MTSPQARRRPQRTSLFDEVRGLLRTELTDGTYAVGDRLPSETQLSTAYALSRATLREILSSLEREGLVRRVHGVGTFVTAPEPQVLSSLNLDIGVTEGLSAAQVPNTVRLLSQASRPIPAWMADRLGLTAAAHGLHVERLVEVNEQPAVHVVDVIPATVLEEAGQPEYGGGSVYAFLEAECHLQLHGGRADIVPVMPTPALAKHLGCARGVPLLRLEQVEYDTSGRAVLFSQEQYLPGVITLTVHRERRVPSPV